MQRFMKEVIKRALGKFGFELKRTNFRPDFLDRIASNHKSKGLIIEFVGPPGVGKTTLFNKVFENHWDNWFSKNNMIYLVNKSEKFPFNFLEDKEERMYNELLIAKYDEVNEINLPLQKKTLLYDFYVQELQYDAFARYSDIPKGLILEEGIIHNFGTNIVDFYANSYRRKIGEEFFHYIFFNRSIICLEASVEYIVNNLKKRSIEHPNFADEFYRFFGYNEAKKVVEKDLSINSKLLAIADRYKASTLKLNTETGVQSELIQEINGFITNEMNNHNSFRKTHAG